MHLTTSASPGSYVVVSLEHADGSSGATQLASGRHVVFSGLGTGAALQAKGSYRVGEVMTTVSLLEQLNAGVRHSD